MNKLQRNRLAMYHAVLAHLDADPALWNTAPPLADAVAALRGTVDDIQAQALLQEQHQTPGHTASKNAQRDAVLGLTVNLARKLRAYARVQNDPVLLATADHAPSDLRQMAEQEMTVTAEALHAAALPHLANLADYQVTQADLDALDAALTAFAPLRAARDVVGDLRTTATAALKTLFAAARTHALLLDDLIPALVDDEAFVATYEATREIQGD